MTAFVALALPLTALAEDNHSHTGLSEGSQEIHKLMEKSSKEMPGMKMTGNVDKDFAATMSHHHQSGIDMAEVQVKYGKDPELKKLAENIIETQKKEMKVLDSHR